jgi:homoserine kinase
LFFSPPEICIESIESFTVISGSGPFAFAAIQNNAMESIDAIATFFVTLKKKERTCGPEIVPTGLGNRL